MIIGKYGKRSIFKNLFVCTVVANVAKIEAFMGP